MMVRRTFMGSAAIAVALFSAVSVAMTACAWAQQPAKLPKVAILSPRAPTAQACGANMQGSSLPCFLDAMVELGYVDGKNVSFSQRARIVDLAAKHNLPAVYGEREFADAGGLMAYATNLPATFRHAATYVQILKGAKPGDLPIEQPTRIELLINLKAAKALGLTIPHSLLLRADEVIQ